MEKDPYQVLGIDRSASPEAIKKAYRRLAKDLHPDRNPGNQGSEERFKDVGRAFEILSDPRKRSLYDRFGHDGLREGFEEAYERAQRSGRGGPGPGGRVVVEEGFGGFGESFADIFGSIFGGGRRAPVPERGADVRADLDLTFREALAGGLHSLRLRVEGTCPSCGGEGVDPSSVSVCPSCGGSGRKQSPEGGLRIRKCPRCHGRGRIAERSCTGCGGGGTKPVERRLEVRIPAGAHDGDTIRLRGQGTPGAKGGPAGDLRVDLHVAVPEGVTIDGDDIRLRLPVTLPEAFEGARIPLRTPWAEIHVTIPKRSNPGTQLRVAGHGMPKRGSKGRGDLYLEVTVVLPDDSGEETAHAVEQLRNAYRDDPREKLRSTFEPPEPQTPS